MSMEGTRRSVEINGNWCMRLYGPQGELKTTRQGHNMIMTNGKELLAQFLASAAASASTWTCKYIAIGNVNTAEADGQTALGSELARHTGTVSYVSGCICQVTATFATGVGTGSIVEYGCFNSNTTGTMFSRDVEEAIAKGANDTLVVTAQYTFS